MSPVYLHLNPDGSREIKHERENSVGEYYILKDHEPVAVNMWEWSDWLNLPFEATRRVAKTVVGEAEVSTVFLGVDHNWLGSGPPILFETMIFGGKGDEHQWRYSTWEQAEAGHKAVVDALTNGTELPA